MAQRIALVTGGMGGLGEAICMKLEKMGLKVVVTYSPGNSKYKEWLKEMEGAGHKFSAYPCDVSDFESCQKMVAEVAKDLGPIDILINNAGVSIPAPIAGQDYDAAWGTTLAVNLTGHTRLIRACLPDLTRNGDGRVVNVASTEALGATAGLSPYTASKHGVVGLTRALAVELGATGVTVNCVCPGPINTGMTAAIPDDMKAKFARRRVPLRRYGEPEEVAHATLGLVLPAMTYVNGAVLVVDGGMTAQNT
jgi:3-oxoacyl-[acyl-carrier protein] reductase